MDEALDKESIIELQKIDCNCNDCAFMVRDTAKFKSFDWLHAGNEKGSERLNYGNCTKLKKPVSFIPGTCQPQTQYCFVHRKDKPKETTYQVNKYYEYKRPTGRDEKAVELLLKYLPMLTNFTPS